MCVKGKKKKDYEVGARWEVGESLMEILLICGKRCGHPEWHWEDKVYECRSAQAINKPRAALL